MMARYLRLFLSAVAALILAGCVGLDFSPDGKSVAISTTRGIVMIPLEGGPKELIPESKDGMMPQWSPDGKRILFTRQVGGTHQLHLYNVDSRRATRIGSRWTTPYVWREDGKRIAAVQNHEDGSAEIVWYDLVEGGVAQATAVTQGPSLMFWLQDTDDLAFMGSHDVYLVEGAEVKRITRTSDVIGLALSASRKELLWARRGKNLKHQLLSIYRFDLARRSVTRLEFPMRIPLINPSSRRAPESIGLVAFSPDSKKLAIVTGHSETVRGRKRDFTACYVMRIDGSDAREVRKTTGVEGSAEILYPVWSRDSARLGVYGLHDKQLVVAVFDSSGANGRRILAEKTK